MKETLIQTAERKVIIFTVFVLFARTGFHQILIFHACKYSFRQQFSLCIHVSNSRTTNTSSPILNKDECLLRRMSSRLNKCKMELQHSGYHQDEAKLETKYTDYFLHYLHFIGFVYTFLFRLASSGYSINLGNVLGIFFYQ